jgi:prevent-host-death family protein
LDQVLNLWYQAGVTIQVNIAEAKARLSELVAMAEAGEEVVLARNGKPVVTLSPRKTTTDRAAPGRRPIGLWDHLGARPKDETFFDPDPDLEALVDEPVWPPG